MFGRDGEM